MPLEVVRDPPIPPPGIREILLTTESDDAGVAITAAMGLARALIRVELKRSPMSGIQMVVPISDLREFAKACMELVEQVEGRALSKPGQGR